MRSASNGVVVFALMIFVVPQFALVVTIFGGRYNQPDAVTEDILLERIIPALR